MKEKWGKRKKRINVVFVDDARVSERKVENVRLDFGGEGEGEARGRKDQGRRIESMGQGGRGKWEGAIRPRHHQVYQGALRAACFAGGYEFVVS